MHDDRRSGAATCCLPSPQREKSCEKALPKDTMIGKDLALGPGWTASHPHRQSSLHCMARLSPQGLAKTVSPLPLHALFSSPSTGWPGSSDSPVPSPSTFAAEVLLHSREADLLMQQLLLLAVLTLRHHPMQPLEVLTAVLATELIHLVLPKRPPPGQPGLAGGPHASRGSKSQPTG